MRKNVQHRHKSGSNFYAINEKKKTKKKENGWYRLTKAILFSLILAFDIETNRFEKSYYLKIVHEPRILRSQTKI